MRGNAVTKMVAGLALTMSCLLLWATPALGAPPANDDFANREVLGGGLPVEVSRSNVEATKESGEYLGTAFTAGHSVWFEWEAPSDGWFTVGGCEANFVDVIGVFTGTSVNALTSVTGANSTEGPHCPFTQREYVFKATNGTKYEIAVDGNPYHLPEAPPPVTEGTFKLRIESTPAPANDDFADATTIVPHLEEEFEGEAFYFGSQFGYNWNATTEGMEPELIGGPSGASVWYSWTSPLTGEAKISSCCGGPDLRLGIYTGNSLETLQLLVGGIEPSISTTFSATAGTTYRLVVYGLLDGSSEAAAGSFDLYVSIHAPVPAPPTGGEKAPPPPPPPDITAPDTAIFKKVLKRKPPIFVFHYYSTEPGSTFRCGLDRHSFAACPSSQRYGDLRPGRHEIKVVAVDAAGNTDPTPAVARFTVPKKPGNRHRAG